ncbi:MAG TPA: crotonase/enoyl-CoA hydratase family protein [Thermoleophilaceae bacterium]|nr:crotonase/enoyl-CoA hydratase family protein [Thermoleophilaceae bacterium]
MSAERLTTLAYEVEGRVARITLDRPERGNGITLDMPRELATCVERADLDPAVHVIALSGNGPGFCGGYDLVESAERGMEGLGGEGAAAERSAADGSASEGPAVAGLASPPPGSPLDPAVQARNHSPEVTWDPIVDWQMMSRNVRGFMSLARCDKPVLCKVHGFCVGGGTDMALCSDLLVVAEDARIGYPPARVWGVPTTALWAHRIGAQRAKRLLFTGDLIAGREAADWGLAVEAVTADRLDRRFEELCERVARLPVNQLVMMKLLVNQSLEASGVASAQTLGTILDGAARHTPEGHAFQRRAAEAGFKAAVRERDEPFGDAKPR